jgi:hypothetical protein
MWIHRIAEWFRKTVNRMSQANVNIRPELPSQLYWLTDAPLFIDADQVSRFYDAVARPQTVGEGTKVEITDETVNELKGKLGLEAGVTTQGLAAALAPILAFVKPSLKVNAEGEGGQSSTHGQVVSYDLKEVDTPQSQLEALALLYLTRFPKRVFFVDHASEPSWRDPKSIIAVPRSLVFLDLPSLEQAKGDVRPTKLIPTAAEFQNGTIELIYPRLLAKNGERPPDYPEERPNETLEQLRAERKQYWLWFDKNYSATTAMSEIEKSATKNGKIRWIDYRLPLNDEGDSLHLHVHPFEKYDTGDLAYNFVKRGFKHGIRIVGTLKSEPDMNVLAIYEK